MRELWNRITNRLGWFIGFLIVSGIFIFFIWSSVDRKGFTTSVNGFLEDTKVIGIYVLEIFFIGLGLCLIWRAVFGRRGGGGGGGRH